MSAMMITGPMTTEKPAPKKRSVGRPSKQRLSIDEYITLFTEFGYNISLNELDDTIELNGAPMTDVDLATLLARVHEFCVVNGYTLENEQVKRCVSLCAKRNAYNPITGYLDILPVWDGIDHIGQLATYITDRQNVFARWFELWFIGVVARAYDHKYQNPVLVLLGAQGLGKSYFARWLCPIPDRYYSGPILTEDKDNRLLLANTLVWEISELPATTRKADIDALKSFLTLERVKLRKAYGYLPIDKPSRASFIATTNDGAFLTDQTGNRRFLTCDLTAIDFTYTTIDLDQLWAQAKHYYLIDDSWKMTAAERNYQAEQNEVHTVSDPLAEWFDAHIRMTNNSGDTLTFEQVWNAMNLSIPASQHRPASMALARWCRIKGIEKCLRTRPRSYLGVKLTQ